MRWKRCCGVLLVLGVALGCGDDSGNPDGTADGGTGGTGGGAGGSSGTGGGAATGGRAGSGGDTATGGRVGITDCVETPMEVALDAATELGFSAAEVLAGVGGDHDLTLYWRTGGLYATHARSDTTTALTLTFDDTAATARYIDSQGGGCPTGGSDAPCIVCQSWLEIDLGLHVVTGDGALDESLDVTLESFDATHPRFAARVPAAMVQGSYFDGITPMDTREIVGLHFQGDHDGGFSGSQATVAGEWNGFAAALLGEPGSSLEFGVMQAHGYYPPATAGQ